MVQGSTHTLNQVWQRFYGAKTGCPEAQKCKILPQGNGWREHRRAGIQAVETELGDRACRHWWKIQARGDDSKEGELKAQKRTMHGEGVETQTDTQHIFQGLSREPFHTPPDSVTYSSSDLSPRRNGRTQTFYSQN